MTMTDMTERVESLSPQSEISRYPKWVQIAGVVLLVLTGLAGVDQFKSSFGDSKQAKAIKAQMAPIAEQLAKAQELGDRQAAFALLDPINKIVSDYNDLDQSRRDEINKTPLRYCALAATHLLGGVINVSGAKAWLDQSKYEAALDACK